MSTKPTELGIASPKTCLSTHRLSKHFGALVANDELSLEIEEGELHALIGPNGAGKTTVLAQLSGEMRPDKGYISYFGADITAISAAKRAQLGIARSFQITSLLEEFSTEDNVAIAIQAHQGHSFRFWRDTRRENSIRKPTYALLERMGLLEQALVPAQHLAHGERRQLEVAMALAGKPKILLLDEPMAGLGTGGTLRMAEVLLQLKQEVTILLVEHDMKTVFSVADRITVLADGKVLVTGIPEEIRSHPGVRTAYLGDTV